MSDIASASQSQISGTKSGKSAMKVEPLMIRAAIMPGSINSEERTLTITASTEYPVRRFDWNAWKSFDEILEHSSRAVNMERITGGAMPVLDNHRSWGGKEDKLGKVTGGRIEDKKLILDLQFSKRESLNEFWQDVVDGIHNTFSIGYNVEEYKRTEDVKTGKVTARATKWTPMEVSVANIPADPNAQSRTDNPKKDNQPENLITVRIHEETPPAPVQEPENTRKMSDLNNPTPAVPANPQVEPVDTAALKREAAAAERTRINDIRTAARAAKVGEDLVEKWIADGTDINTVRAAIIDQMAKADKGPTPTPDIRMVQDEKVKTRKAMTDALLLRSNAPVKLEGEALQNARGIGAGGVIQIMERCLQDAGIDTLGMGRAEIAQAAMNVRGFHSTSDFPLLWQDAMHKSLQAAYEMAPRTFLPWTTREDFPDFRVQNKYSTGGLSALDLMTEGAEFQYGTFGEEREQYQGFTYGKAISFTFQMAVNDDLSVLNRTTNMIAEAVAAKQSDLVYAILNSNPNMGDGVALFHADHGNLGTGGAPSDTTLSEIRQLAREQTGLTNTRGDQHTNYLNIMLEYLIAGPQHETIVQKLLTSMVYAETVGNTNVWRGSMTPIIEPRISGTKWFACGSPRRVPTIIYGFLSGMPEIDIQTKEDFNTRGLLTSVMTSFAAKALDWRNLYYNPGA